MTSRQEMAHAAPEPPPSTKDAMCAVWSDIVIRWNPMITARLNQPEAGDILGMMGHVNDAFRHALSLPVDAPPPLAAPEPPALRALVERYQRAYAVMQRVNDGEQRVDADTESDLADEERESHEALLAYASTPVGAEPEFWLGELGVEGKPVALVDGPHSGRAGVDRAAYLSAALGLQRGREYVCVEAVVTPVVPSAEGVNHEAVAQNRRVIRETK